MLIKIVFSDMPSELLVTDYNCHELRGNQKPFLEKLYLKAWLKFAADHTEKEKAFWKTFCGQMKIILAVFLQNIFGGRKVWPLNLGTSDLLSSMTMVVLFPEAVLLVLYSKWNNEKGELAPHSSGKPKVLSQNVDREHSWVFQQDTHQKW